MSDKFMWEPDDIIVSQCLYCRHKRRGTTCSAFPDSIPAAILRNDHDHRQPYRGDHGIHFEPVDTESARIVADLFGDSDQ